MKEQILANLMETFKTAVRFVIDDNWKSNFSIMLKLNRGDPTRPKKECSKSNAPTAAKPLWFPSSLQQVSQFTAKLVSRSTWPNSQKMVVQTSVLTRNKPGPDEEITGMEEKRKNPPASSNGCSAHSKASPFQAEDRLPGSVPLLLRLPVTILYYC